MPPKKTEQTENLKILWGRPGNTLKMGIVGLPNVGKSTTFNLLSKLSVPAENYPFCTKDPNLAKVNVPDDRFNKLCQVFKPKKETPATLSIMDIAGLVPGASKGEGLGNAFLSHIKECDGIYHVVRAFEDPDIIHTELEVDPIRDMEIINKELLLKDLDYLQGRVDDLTTKIKRQSSKQLVEEKEFLERALNLLNEGKWIRQGKDWTAKDIEILNQHLFLTAKPVIYLVNLSIEDYKRKKNKWLAKIKKHIEENVEGLIIPYSAEYERQLLEEELANKEETKSNDDKQEVAEEKAPSMMNRIIQQGYKLLDLIYYFTSGPDEVRCWTVRQNTKAPKAAGIIHTDFEKGFICADVMKYDDFIRLGCNETNVKAQGLYKMQGKEYIVEDGDMIYFKVGQIKK